MGQKRNQPSAQGLITTPGRTRPSTVGLEIRCSIQLSYGRMARPVGPAGALGSVLRAADCHKRIGQRAAEVGAEAAFGRGGGTRRRVGRGEYNAVDQTVVRQTHVPHGCPTEPSWGDFAMSRLSSHSRNAGVLVVVLLAGGLGGCSGLTNMLSNRPTAKITGVRLQDINLQSITLLFDVEIGNPYPVSAAAGERGLRPGQQGPAVPVGHGGHAIHRAGQGHQDGQPAGQGHVRGTAQGPPGRACRRGGAVPGRPGAVGQRPRGRGASAAAVQAGGVARAGRPGGQHAADRLGQRQPGPRRRADDRAPDQPQQLRAGRLAAELQPRPGRRERGQQHAGQDRQPAGRRRGRRSGGPRVVLAQEPRAGRLQHVDRPGAPRTSSAAT